MKKILILVLFLFSLLVLTSTVEAKILPQAKQAAQKGNTSTKVSGSFKARIQVTKDKKNAIFNFINLQDLKEDSLIKYELIYEISNGQTEGAGGSINVASLKGAKSTSAKVYLGTCSKNVCKPHIGVKNLTAKVTYTNKAGQTRTIKQSKSKL